LVTAGAPATLAAKRAGGTIPIVLVGVDDPVALGVVESLTQTRGSVTGLSLSSPEMIAQRLLLLRGILPSLRRLAVIVRRDDPQIAVMYYRIGEVHLLQSRIDEAIGWLVKAHSANMQLPHVHAFLASAYALRGETERAAAELGQARHLDDRYSNITQLTAGFYWVPKTRALWEATYFAGLRKAGMPEE
jgi:tetratricopeptide (TPR) repeat protein